MDNASFLNRDRIPFGLEEEERIASAGIWGLIVAIGSILSSVLTLLGSLMMAYMVPPSGAAVVAKASSSALILSGVFTVVVTAVLGGFLIQASLALRKVATTDHADHDYLIQGFAKLRNYFKLLGLLCIMGVCSVILVFCLALT